MKQADAAPGATIGSLGVFDSIEIPGFVTIVRGTPLERGSFSPQGSGAWVPEPIDTQVLVEGFGIDVGGNAYLDAQEATEGEEAQLWVNPRSAVMWLQPVQL